ncbi:TonB-dependent receptor [Novosphingobium sp. MW5]|nr:TonB-dependent receptor [Novosphingobium sp. MW5]
MRVIAKNMLLLGAALAALTAPAYADEADGGDTAAIVVKGQPAGETVWTAPASIANLDARELEARQFTTLSSLTQAFANVSLDEIGTFKGVSNFAIRGLGVNSSIPSIDPAVGLYVDGVYMGVNAGSVFDALDVESVQMLRGPQGVVFGRNTTGGAVLVNTADPDFDQWSGQVRLGFESPIDNERGSPLGTARLVVSGPVSDTIAVRFGALHTTDGGYFKNGLTGAPVGGFDNTVLRAGLSWKAAPDLKLTIKGEWNRSDGDGAPTHNNGQNARDSFSLSINEPGYHHSNSRFVTARAEYDAGPGTLTSVFGWRKYDLSTRNDIDSSPVTIFHSDTRTRQEQVSNDLYYTYGLGAVDLTLGSYLFHQSVGYEEVRYLAANQYGGGRMKHDQAEVYGQAAAELAAGLKVTAGLRWSYEAKHAFVTYVRPRSACSAVDGTCPISGNNSLAPTERNGFEHKASWRSLSPSVKLGWEAAEGAYLWGGWSRGRRSGGYNLRITQPAAFEQVAATLGSPAYQPEQVDSYELGAKWQTGDGRLSVQATLFQSDVDNMQREINVPSATSGLAQSIFNTADARIRGGELEVVARPFEGLSLNASLGHIDARYTSVKFDINSDGVINAADLLVDLPRAPRWTWGLGGSYRAGIGEHAAITARADFQHRSRFAYTDNNWGWNSASDRVDASITLDLGQPAIRLTVFGRNLLDQVQFGGDTQLPFAGGAFSDGNNRPYDPRPAAGTFSPLAKGRTVGLEAAMDF